MRERYVVEILWELVTVRRECERGFRSNAERARGERLRKLLLSQVRQCSDAARELAALIASLGGEGRPRREPVAKLQLVRAMRWGARARADEAVRRDDGAVLEDCEQGAGCLLQAYRNALDDFLPEQVSGVLLQQLESAVAAHEQIRELAASQALRAPAVAQLGAHASTQ